jgi:hypothetical protein
MITSVDVDRVTQACSALPRADGVYLADDFVTALVETVVDFQQHTTTVERAMEHFVRERRPSIASIGDLQETLANHPDTQAGNTALAQALWGYKLWTRAHMLRGLVSFFDEEGVRDLESLRQWAASSGFQRDFEGRVKGLGPAVYNWLVMRMGVETVKPDVRLRRFVERCLERPVSDQEIVDVVSVAARTLGLKAYELDWAIWESERPSV